MNGSRVSVFAAAAATGLLLTFAPATITDATSSVDLQLLAINDFHGHLEPNTPGTVTPTPGAAPVKAGGAAYLATHVRKLERTNPNTLVVSAGDLIGASPFLSAVFYDEPTIEAMNTIGLDLNAVGNHELDEGVAELRRMRDGGCRSGKRCSRQFRGADFGFLAANSLDDRTRKTLFPPYAIKEFDGVKVGFIGMTLKNTPEVVVSPDGAAGLLFLDEAKTANRYAEQLRDRGVQAIVVLLHEGGVQSSPYGINGCDGISGPVVDIVTRTTRAVDLFVTGHTHRPYNCVIDSRPVTSAASFGRLVTDIDLTLHKRSRDVTRIRVNNRVVTQTVGRAKDVEDLVARYDKIAAPTRDRTLGHARAPISRKRNRAGESALGDIIADAQLAATADEKAVAAFVNSGMIRSEFDAGPVTYGEAYTALPFGNHLVTMTLSGAKIDALLEQQWCGQDTTSPPRMLQVSASVSYTWDASAPVCDRVSGIRIGGRPLDLERRYRITVNSFLASGGDRFTVLREGVNRARCGSELGALQAYLAARSPLSPGPQTRITGRH